MSQSQGPAAAAESAAAPFKHLSASDTWNLLLERGGKGLVVLDARDEKAFAQSHVDGARHVTEARVTETLAQAPKSSTIVIYCYDGRASQGFAALVSSLGYDAVYSVAGGFEALAREHAERRTADASERATLPRPEARYIVGDVVFAREAIHNDGGMPELAADALVAQVGARGVIVQVGSAEADPRRTVYAVRFEDAAGTLGSIVGCLPEELTQEQTSEAILP